MKYGLFASMLMVVALTSGAARGQEMYQEGSAYQTIAPEQPTSTKNKIEVVELFWYGCPHCNKIEMDIERWQKTKADDIEFIRMPAILREEWTLHARTFYAAEALGVMKQFHTPFFTAIHAHKRKLDSEEAIAAFFGEIGVNKEDFTKTFHSFSVDAKTRRALEMSRRYGAHATPSFVVNGKYRLSNSLCETCPSFTNTEVLNIVDFLAQKERKAKP